MNTCSVYPHGTFFDWIVAAALIMAAFFHFLINRDPEIEEPAFLTAARWILCTSLAALSAKYLYILILGSRDTLTASFTALGMFGVALSQVLFGLYTFQKYHNKSSNSGIDTPVSKLKK